MGSDGDPAECAILIFAFTAKDAKRLLVRHWPGDVDSYLDFQVRWLKGNTDVFKNLSLAQELRNEPIVVDSPTGCPSCDKWGIPLMEDGRCKDCWDEDWELKVPEGTVVPGSQQTVEVKLG